MTCSVEKAFTSARRSSSWSKPASGKAPASTRSRAQQAVPLDCIDQQIHQLAERLLCEGLAQQLLVRGVRVVGALLDGCSLRFVITGGGARRAEPYQDG